MPKSPMSRGIRPIPSARTRRPKSNRGLPTTTSIPIKLMLIPRVAMIRDLKIDPRPR